MKQTDFFFSHEEEPHKARCREILKAHPEVTTLIGRNPYTFLILLLFVGIQFSMAYWVASLGFAQYWWVALLGAWLVGSLCNHGLYVVIHEATHNLIFKKRLLNKLSLILADTVNVIPGGIGFSLYHLKHHAHQGNQGIDADMCSDWEAKLIRNIWWRKALWLLFFPLFQLSRVPRIQNVKTITGWTVVNASVLMAINVALWVYWGPNAVFYLVCSFFFGVGLHPVGARWIQEHYTLHETQETFSYYGPFNFVALNVGYHNEHHDFPSIPWNKLPKLKAMAPEFYENLEYHTSWSKLLMEFLFDKKYSLYSRVERNK